MHDMEELLQRIQKISKTAASLRKATRTKIESMKAP